MVSALVYAKTGQNPDYEVQLGVYPYSLPTYILLVMLILWC